MLGDDAVAGSTTATARGSNDHFDIRQIFKNLETDHADAGNQLRLVSRMHVAIAFGQGDAFSLSARIIEITAMQSHFGAQITHRQHLRFINIFNRSVDDDAHAEQSPGISYRLPMIAGARRYHSGILLLIGRSSYQVDAAAHLEGAHWLQVL